MKSLIKLKIYHETCKLIQRNRVLKNIKTLGRELANEHYGNEAAFNAFAYSGITYFSECAFFDAKSLFTIKLDNTTYINLNKIIFVDPEDGMELDSYNYRNISEEEYFQLSTIYDFGDMEYRDIKFISNIIDELTLYSKESLKLIRQAANELSKQLSRQFAEDMTKEIDRGIITHLINMAPTVSKPSKKTRTPPYKPHTATMPYGYGVESWKIKKHKK